MWSQHHYGRTSAAALCVHATGEKLSTRIRSALCPVTKIVTGHRFQKFHRPLTWQKGVSLLLVEAQRQGEQPDDDDEAQNDVHPLDWVSHLAQGELDDQQHGHAKSVSHDTSRSTTSFPHHSCDGGDDARNQSEVPEAFMHLAKMYPGKHAHSEDGLNDD